MKPQSQISRISSLCGLLLPKTAFDYSNDPVQSFLLIRTLADELYLVAAFDAGSEHAENTFCVGCGIAKMKFNG